MAHFNSYTVLGISLVRILAGILLGYLLFCVYVYLNQEGLLFITQSISDERLAYVSEAGDGRVEEISIVSEDGTQLHGWVLHGRSTELAQPNTVLYFGGNAEEVSHMVDHVSRFNDWSFILMNYRGYGLSGGRPS